MNMGFLSHTWIGCLIAFLPGSANISCVVHFHIMKTSWTIGQGPPSLKFENAHFQLFPVDKTNKYCPEVQAERDVGFYFYSRKLPEEPQKLRIGDDVALASSNLDLRLPTVIYFPPFFDGIDSKNVREIKEVYLKREDHNFIVVDSERLNAGPWYFAAVTNTFVVGKYTAVFIDYLLLRGLLLKNLHLVGFSIGAHAAGIAGKYIKLGKPSRITGLDPASFLFMKKPRNMRLDKSDADFVDVIHTDKVFGMFYPIGQVDFFIDSDVYPQSGCNIRDVFRQSKGFLHAIFCSHLRSNKLYAKSVICPTVYLGSKCSSWKNFQIGLCKPELVNFMGFNTPSSARGIYYIRTRSYPLEIT